MATIDFTTNTNIGQPGGGCGCTAPGTAANVYSAVQVWNGFYVNPANWPPTLTIAGGTTYNFTTTPSLTDQLTVAGVNPTISAGAGTIFTIASAFGQFGYGSTLFSSTDLTYTCGVIDNVRAGSTAVTLLNSSDASKFSVGQWVLLGGLELQPSTFPPNWQFFEYNTVVGISGNTILLGSALKNGYSKGWPKTNTPPVNPIDNLQWDGPGVIVALPPWFDNVITYTNIEFTGNSTGIQFAGGRRYIFNGCRWDGKGPSVSLAKEIYFQNTCIFTQETEVDKCIDYMELNSGSNVWADLYMPSPSPNVLKINGATVNSFAGGPNVQAINSSTLGPSTIMNIGPGSFGRGTLFSVDGTSTIASPKAAVRGFGQPNGLALSSSNYVYIGNGVFQISKTGAAISDCLQSAVPGAQYLVAHIASGPFFDPDVGGRHYFCVNDIYEDASNVYIKTDLSGYPADTFNNGLAADTWASAPCYVGQASGIPSSLANNWPAAAQGACAVFVAVGGGFSGKSRIR